MLLVLTLLVVSCVPVLLGTLEMESLVKSTSHPIIGLVVALVLILMTITAIVVIVVVLRRKKQASPDLEASPGEANTSNQPPVYEPVDEYEAVTDTQPVTLQSLPPQPYRLSTCPAYAPNTGGVKADTAIPQDEVSSVVKRDVEQYEAMTTGDVASSIGEEDYI